MRSGWRGGGPPFLHLSYILKGQYFSQNPSQHSLSRVGVWVEKYIMPSSSETLTVVWRKQFRSVHYHLQAKKAVYVCALITGYNYCPTRYFWSNNLCSNNRYKLRYPQQIGTVVPPSVMDMSVWVDSLLFPISQASSLLRQSSTSPPAPLLGGSDSSPHWQRLAPVFCQLMAP